LGFKAIPIKQTLIIIIYTAFFSFILNDFIKFWLLKKWPLNIPEKL